MEHLFNVTMSFLALSMSVMLLSIILLAYLRSLVELVSTGVSNTVGIVRFISSSVR